MAEVLSADKATLAKCYHCGESCKSGHVRFDEKDFCCDGCKFVYDLLRESSLCTYYSLNSAPGISPSGNAYSGKYAYLDDKQVSGKLIHFEEGEISHITFYIPGIHCSSCIWLLENLQKANSGVISSSVNFLRKEATVIFDIGKIKLSEVVELLAHIGYEPLISLKDLEKDSIKTESKIPVLKIGLAGFCFGNIMMLSFPEYFSFGNFYDQEKLPYFFGYLNLFLSLPVFFYCSSVFFVSAWKSIRHRYLNIDAPIALAILVTFVRSVYEILSHTGSGYMDSMSGIVFFMLLGRFYQHRTYQTLSFERDYKSYFPVGVSVKLKNGSEVNLPVSELKKGDHIIIRNNELVPSDATLLSDRTHVDYSFITGESAPVKKQAGDFIYAGGRQLDGAIELEVVNPASQSYLTQLWNKDNNQPQSGKTYVDIINKYFTVLVLLIASLSAAYWMFNDNSKALNALTAVLIVACPCGLLLTTTFANGNVLRIFGRNKLYLKNAETIDKIRGINTILFDKTGTITRGSEVKFEGRSLSGYELQLVSTLASQSSHPLSRAICRQFPAEGTFGVTHFEELPGNGLRGMIDGKQILVGSEFFVTGHQSGPDAISGKVFLKLDDEIAGYFKFDNAYRTGLNSLFKSLSEKYSLKLISGDNDAEGRNLQQLFSKNDLYFNQKPGDKMKFVQDLRQQGHSVMMIGDGLNDAGALQQSDVGIAISDDTNNFTPASDAILDGSALIRLPDFIKLARLSKKVIILTFIISLTYNFIGLFFAVQGLLAPVIAAILMPASSISIVLLATGITSFVARKNGL